MLKTKDTTSNTNCSPTTSSQQSFTTTSLPLTSPNLLLVDPSVGEEIQIICHSCNLYTTHPRQSTMGICQRMCANALFARLLKFFAGYHYWAGGFCDEVC